METNVECVILVLLEMGISFAGIVSNLLIVTTLRQDESLKGSTLNYLLLNLCFSNLLIAFLVKPISAIYVGYSISTGEYQVGLAFCTLYTFTYRTTWCVFPFTLVAMCWCKLLAQLKCTMCNYFCCPVEDIDEIEAANEEGGAEMAVISGTNNEDAIGLAPVEQNKTPSPVPFTDIAIQYGSGQVRHGGSLLFQSMNRDSLSTPTPSTTTELCHQVSQSSTGPQQQLKSFSSSGDDANAIKKNNTIDSALGQQQQQPLQQYKRTLEDGPTTRQKLLVTFIWISAAFFGVTTCFPDKVFGVEISQKILEDQLRTMVPPSQGTPREMDLTYCTVKTGMNDLLDYIALCVALIIPLILGPGIVGTFQALIFFCSRFLCPPPHVSQFEAVAVMVAGPAGPQLQSGSNTTTFNSAFNEVARRGGKGPGWTLIMGFTIAFVATYPIHMYVAEVYIEDRFTFLLVKYTVGFMFVIFVPLIALTTEADLRTSILSMMGSAVFCFQGFSDIDDDEKEVVEEDENEEGEATHEGQEQRVQQQQQEKLLSEKN